VLEVTIDEEGNVETARPLSGNPKLEQEAIQEVKKRKLEPGEISGKKVKTIRTIEYPFKVKEGVVP
jgi:outer membrane biosynthesis protein TonB